MTKRSARVARWEIGGPILKIGAFLLCCLSAAAVSVDLAWDPSPSGAVEGYTVFYGYYSGVYNFTIDVGGATSATIENLIPQTPYFFSISGYDGQGNWTAPSAEVEFFGDATGGPPLITAQPASQTVGAGTVLDLVVAASSATPVSYQWTFGGEAIDGATNAEYILDNVGETDAGDYAVTLANVNGTTVSADATVLVAETPVILNAFSYRTVQPGATVRLRAEVSGGGDMNYQWFFDGAPIGGVNGAALVLSDVTVDNCGRYALGAWNEAGSNYGAVLGLQVYNPYANIPGTYNGLFFVTNADGTTNISADSTGLLSSCTVAGDGTYSATVEVAGNSYALAGGFDVNGNDTQIIDRSAESLSSLAVWLHADLTGAAQALTGSVTGATEGNPWVAPLNAPLRTTNTPVPFAGTFALVMPYSYFSDAGAPTVFGMVQVSRRGGAALTAAFSDGSWVSEFAGASSTGDIPIYASLFDGAGVVAGWINVSTTLASGTLTWSCPAGADPVPEYSGGFTNTSVVY